jgi:hypothetical protein
VAGRIPEREYTGDELEAETTTTPRKKSGVRILVDVKDPDWREKLVVAYTAAAEAMGIKFDPDQETIVIKEGL